MNTDKFNSILQKYMDGKCTDDERIIIERWCDFVVKREQKAIPNPAESKAKIYKEIILANALQGEVSKKQFQLFRAAEAMAAAFIICVLCFAVYNSGASLRTPERTARQGMNAGDSWVGNPESAPQKILLSDGTEVILDAQSGLKNIRFESRRRELRLAGKAFFNVAHNPQRPFYIYTENIVVRVLGTSFTIDAPQGEGETVAVKTGLVAVYHSKPSTGVQDSFITVTPNYQVQYNKSRQRLIPSIVAHPEPLVAPPHEAGEGKGFSKKSSSLSMEFAGTNAVEVFEKLENVYGVKIRCDKEKLASCVVTITLVEEDLYARLHAICVVIGGSYLTAGEEIVIKSKGCKPIQKKGGN